MAAQQQQRHQVLEHRAAPRHQRGAALDAHQRARQPEPVLLRHLAARDGDEAREPRLGREQVVVRGIEPARPLGVGEPEADREDAARAVVEERPVHRVGERVAAPRQVASRSRRPRRCGAAAPASTSAVVERAAPVGDRRRPRRPRGASAAMPLERGAQAGRCDAARAREPRRAPAPSPASRRAQRVELALRARRSSCAQRCGARARAGRARSAPRPARPRCRRRPRTRAVAVLAAPAAISRSPAASVISAPARLPLSTVET